MTWSADHPDGDNHAFERLLERQRREVLQRIDAYESGRRARRAAWTLAAAASLAFAATLAGMLGGAPRPAAAPAAATALVEWALPEATGGDPLAAFAAWRDAEGDDLEVDDDVQADAGDLWALERPAV